MGRNVYDQPTEVSGGAATISSGSGTQALGGRAQHDERTRVMRANHQATFAMLAIVKGSRAGIIERLRDDETTIGRDAENDIVLDDEYCGRNHAKIRIEPDDQDENKPAHFIWDLATKNGTLVNDKSIVRSRLADGDKVQIGDTVMVFKKV